MNLSGNTIFIAGATSGIGRGLAERFADAGNRVIIAGRRQHLVDEIVAGEMRAETGSSCAPCCARRRIQADVKRDPRTRLSDALCKRLWAAREVVQAPRRAQALRSLAARFRSADRNLGSTRGQRMVKSWTNKEAERVLRTRETPSYLIR